MGFATRRKRRADHADFVTLAVWGLQPKIACEFCQLADRALPRMRGLLGRRRLLRGEGVLLRPASAVHTWFMRFPIDVLFLDRELKIVAIRPGLRPWRAAAFMGAHAVLELSAGEAERRRLSVGEPIAVIGPAATGNGALESLIERVGLLLRGDRVNGNWPEIESLLTEGYAHTLHLEARRWKIEESLSRPVPTKNRRGVARIRSLVDTHEQLDREIQWLRALLAELREHGTTVRPNRT
jgi:uncharacterized membrane protein (UPF0127 family)